MTLGKQWTVDDLLMLESGSVDDMLMLKHLSKVLGTKGFRIRLLLYGIDDCIVSMIASYCIDKCIASRWLHSIADDCVVSHRWLDDRIDEYVVSRRALHHMIATYRIDDCIASMSTWSCLHEILWLKLFVWTEIACTKYLAWSCLHVASCMNMNWSCLHGIPYMKYCCYSHEVPYVEYLGEVFVFGLHEVSCVNWISLSELHVVSCINTNWSWLHEAFFTKLRA